MRPPLLMEHDPFPKTGIHPRSGSRTCFSGSCSSRMGQGVGAFSPSTLPTVSFHSLVHSAPQRLAQPASTAPSSSFLCVSASSGLTATMVDFASLPMLQGCLPVLQLSASPVVVLIVAHILSS